MFGIHIETQDSSITKTLNFYKEQTDIGNVIQIFMRNPMSLSSGLYEYETAVVLNPDVQVYVHCNYLLNFCNPNDHYKWACKTLIDEMNVAEKIPQIRWFVLHMGTILVQQSPEDALKSFIQNILYVLNQTQNRNVGILFETPHTKGNKLASTLSELVHLIENPLFQDVRERIGICVDTAHVFYRGYQISESNEFQKFMAELKKHHTNIHLIHLNDAYGEFGTKLDRHGKLGDGYIFGKNAEQRANLQKLVQWLNKAKISFVLESRYKESNDIESYREELKLLPVMNIDEMEEEKSRALLMSVHGIGEATANNLLEKYAIFSIDDLKEPYIYDTLTTQQQAGVKYYKELHEKIFREHVENYVKIYLEPVFEKFGFQYEYMGSMRRGKTEVRDIDILLWSPYIKTKDDLESAQYEKSLSNLSRYLPMEIFFGTGITKLSGLLKTIHKQIDIRLAPYDSLATFRLYFGSGVVFSKWIRTEALRKGYHLNEWGLYKHDEKIPTKTERDVFVELGLDYVEPNLR